MWRTEGYVPVMLGLEQYLLPYGQMIAENRHGMKLNEAGMFLWEALPEVRNREELYQRFLEFCEAEEEDYAQIRKDMEEFLEMFASWGMCREEEELPESWYQIGGLNIRILAPLKLIPKEFSPFAISKEEHDSLDMTIRVYNTSGTLPYLPDGKILVQTENIMVCEREKGYLLRFPKLRQIRKAEISKDSREARIFCLDSDDLLEEIRNQLFHAIRPLYLYAAQKNGIFAIHSASLLYREKAWIFSAPSGTGKSTHTDLWKKLFGTPVLNGDLNLISVGGDGGMVHGLPWCGTSGISDTGSYPLGGIFFLVQSPEDRVVSLSEEEKNLMIMQRLISPSWTKEQALCNFHFAERIKEHILVKKLLCTKEDSAAQAAKCSID